MTVVINTLKPVARAEPADKPAPLYVKRKAIYPKRVKGPFRQLKWGLLLVMLGIYYGVPWIRWARPAPQPQQAVLVDFLHGRFFLFGLHLWPDEVYFITALLVISALSLFLVSALFGRLWCGYACPQTVWTDLFIAVERLFEGDRNARMHLDAQPWSVEKALRKGGKHAVWLLVGMATGGAWIFYFHDAPTTFRQFFVGQAPPTAYIFFWLLTFTTYIFAGTMREQVCTYLCPWPRIQGAMLDKDSLQVTYRYDRGEPRGAHKKGADWSGRGDCIECTQCVVACPMGIDIRDGLQLECINCGLCIDACDEVMVKVGRPKGLIAFDTDANVLARANNQPTRLRLVRPRTIFYGVALTGVLALTGYGLATRPTFGLHVVRDRAPLFVRLHDGSIRNGYTLEIANRSFERRKLDVIVRGPGDVGLREPGEAGSATGHIQITAEADQVTPVRLFATLPAAVLPGPLTPIRVTLVDAADGKTVGAAGSVFTSDTAAGR